MSRANRSRIRFHTTASRAALLVPALALAAPVVSTLAPPRGSLSGRAAGTLAAQERAGPAPTPAASAASRGVSAPGDLAPVESADVPDLWRLVTAETSALRPVVERYAEDRAALRRRWSVDYSPERRARFREFYETWEGRLAEIDLEALGLEGRVDAVLLDNEVRYELALLDREDRLFAEMQRLLPFADRIMELEESRRAREPVDARGAAEVVAALPDAIEETRRDLETRLEGASDREEGRVGEEDPAGDRASAREDASVGERGAATADPPVSRIVGLRAAEALESLRETFEAWYGHYAGYDPLFTWWVQDPYAEADSALDAYVTFLEEEIVGFEEGEDPPIVGDPIGAEGLAVDLAHEMIPYTAEELIAIAERELAWCDERMLEASRELGFGDDWHAALEHVKTLHREPGDQPALVRELAAEAVAFLRERDLVTIPPLAEEVWRVEMMSPEMQKVAPFFLGGEVIRVSFPTAGMDHEDKLMSMRGNNVHFSRATVHHELIPGHHLQGFMTERHNPHRDVFSTPFWGEGWALYWEMRLWDLGFPQTPEDRVGMLFWRMHRAARIIFSLSFHLGEMTPEEAIDFLVERVGHERANAEAEVRRSFNGTYSPLYQAAYMLGGLQIRALHERLVESGAMTEREFHDAILQGGRMPIEMVRARLLGERPPRDFTPSWRFYGDPLEDR